ncbi:PhzF family phenazine biosynthesis protein [Gemmatimonadota bacterium]
MSSGAQIPFYQVDAFTDRIFGGNPAGVCLPEEPLPPQVMQDIAAEVNLSETAFVGPAGEDGVRHLQWFTPTVEVPLCGHATLATAHVLFREVGAEPPFAFETLSGILTVDEEKGGWLRMDFPQDPPRPFSQPGGLLEALGCPPTSVVLRAVKAWLVRVPTEADVRSLDPDMRLLEEVGVGDSALGVIVTAPADGEVDFVSRFFGPWVGVPEDPVTGMAHTILTPYWVREMGAATLKARQVSRRGGDLKVRMAGDRVQISGQAVTVVRGTLTVRGA